MNGFYDQFGTLPLTLLVLVVVGGACVLELTFDILPIHLTPTTAVLAVVLALAFAMLGTGDIWLGGRQAGR